MKNIINASPQNYLQKLKYLIKLQLKYSEEYKV